MLLLPEGLQTERLQFRRLVPGDHDAWMPFFNDPLSTRYLGSFDGTYEARCNAWLQAQEARYQDGNGLLALRLRQNGALAGQCGLLKQEIDGIIETEIGYHLLPRYRGMGLATEAAAACKTFFREHCPGQHVISIIHKDNLPSQQVAIRNGMRKEKETLYHGMEVYVFRDYDH